jgi:segregation and condensation protein B
MSVLQSQIESLLFISVRPLSYKVLQEKTGTKKKEDIIGALEGLKAKYNIEGSGVSIQHIDDKVQMVTAGENAELIGEYLKEETTGELTPASLETLTVIAYRGPISKTELELIRGVNCSLILKNLLMRGLIEESKDADGLISMYQITFDFLKYLGIREARELPEYESLNSDENLQKLLHPDEVQESEKEEVGDMSEIKE